MALYQFKNAVASEIGTTGSDVYTVPADKKSILIGCSVANITGSILPVEVSVVKSDLSVIYLARSARIEGGMSADFLSGKKLVLQAGEKLRVVSKLDDSLDCVVSVLEDVD
jgi:hypothetical protein